MIGRYLVARPACYEVLSESPDDITTEIVAAGDDGMIGRIVAWPRAQVEASLMFRDMQLVERRPAWAGTPQGGEDGRKKRARAHDQGRLA